MTDSVLPTSTVSGTHPGMAQYSSNQVGGKSKRGVGRPRRPGRPSKKALKRRAAAKTARRMGKSPLLRRSQRHPREEGSSFKPLKIHNI